MVRHHREIAGMTQAMLAERIDRSVQLIGRIERGQSAPSFETLEALSNAMGVEIREFFGAGNYAVGAHEADGPLGRLLDRVTRLNPEDLEWVTTLVVTALDRRSTR